MVVIRLSRCGSIHRPRYRVTVADSRFSSKGRFIDIIGYYDSFCKDKKKAFRMDIEKYRNWTKKGAQPSQTIRSLAKKVYSV